MMGLGQRLRLARRRVRGPQEQQSETRSPRPDGGGSAGSAQLRDKVDHQKGRQTEGIAGCILVNLEVWVVAHSLVV